MAVTGAEIEHSIKGVRFPASIDDLAEQANKNNANKNIIQAIKELPNRTFSNALDVSNEYNREK